MTFGTAYYTYFEGEGDAAAAEAAKASEAAKAAEEAAKGAKTYTQDEVNKMILQERKSNEEKTRNQIKELENLKGSKTLSDADKTALQGRIDKLAEELLTKEQLAQKDKEKLQREHEEKYGAATQELESWKTRYHDTEIRRAISDASVSQEAFDPAQIAALLRPSAYLEEIVDANGGATGNYLPKVKFDDVDKDKKPVRLDLTISEAVKRMKETPEKYGNLFKSNLKNGMGMNGNVPPGGTIDYTKLTPEQYRQFGRKQIGLSK